MPVRVGINGFGRIGRNVLRAVVRDGAALEIVAVNDLSDAATLAHLLRHDSVHGRFAAEVEVSGDDLIVAGRRMCVLAEEDPSSLPWRDLGVQIVIESTGAFSSRAAAARHLDAGARRVIVSAPGDDVDLTVCMGVNHGRYDPDRHAVISNASCTTNCLAPVLMVLDRGLGIEKAWMTTVHSYTNDQRILDLPHRDLRRARAAALSIIPTTTGAARAVGLVLPELTDRVEGCAVRVPTPDVSLIDVVAHVGRAATAGAVNDLFRAAAAGDLAGVLAVCDEPLVSIDYTGSPLSATVDAELTSVVGGDMVHVIAWYDNEMGYSTRLKDVTEYVAAREEA